MGYINFILLAIITTLIGCGQNSNNYASSHTEQEAELVKTINKDAKVVRDYVVKNAVIAHRGSTYWTPEETEPAFRWARNIGADYLELDLQLTKDSVLIALHDDNLSRTTNVSVEFPERAESPVIEFTLKELRSLDAGTWFNDKNPDRAREKFEGLNILTFKDVLMIAEGHRIKMVDGSRAKELKDNKWTGFYEYERDPHDNGNRPGIYAETKKPNLEKLLAKELLELGWDINNEPKIIKTLPGKVAIANTNGRIVLQSFSPESIMDLERYMPGIPKCFLLWRPEMKDSLKENYIKAINFAVKNNVQFIGPSIAGEPNNYGELTAPWMTRLIHSSGMNIHPYTFDTSEQLTTYGSYIDGVFTNRADLALKFYDRLNGIDPEQILLDLGY